MAATPLSLLVGRDRELAILRERFATALTGNGGLVLIGGEAGIGKTALAETICQQGAQHGALVLVGRCYDLTETPPYGPWVELFARDRSRDNNSPLAEAFVQRGTIGAVTSQADLFQQVLDFCVACVTQRPLVILLDDLHWSDPASLDLLRFLARSSSTLPLLLIVTYRADELTRRHPLYQLLPTLEHEAAAVRVNLRPFSAAAVRALVAARYPLCGDDTTRLTAYLHARAEGNAFFTAQLLRALEEDEVLRVAGDGWTLGDLDAIALPMALRQVIDARLARLGAEAEQFLAVAAVIGQEVPLDTWASVADTDEDVLVGLIEHAAEKRILDETPRGEGIRFSHALIREALYDGLPAVRRRRLHRRIGDVLTARLNPDPDAVAYHFQQAGDDRASEWLLTAGERASRAYAWLTAADRFESALAGMEATGVAIEQRGWLLYRIAVMRRWTNPRQGVAYLTEAERVGRDARDDALIACAMFHRGHLRCIDGDLGQGITELTAGVAARLALPRPVREKLRPLLILLGLEDEADGQGTLIGWLCKVGRYTEARDVGERAIAAMPTAATTRGVVREDVFDGLAHAYAALGMPHEAHDAFIRAQASFRAVGHPLIVGSSAINLLSLVLLPYYPERLAERQRVAAEAVDAWTGVAGARPGLQQYAPLSLMLLEGKWAVVRQRALTARSEQPSTYCWIARRLLALIAHAQGDVTLTWELVHEVLPAGPATEPGILFWAEALVMQRLASALALDAGDLAASHVWLEAQDRWLAWNGAVLGRSEAAGAWARYYHVAGDARRAYEHATRARAHATEPRQPLALLAAHRLLGTLGTAAGRYQEAMDHLDTALSLSTACATPYEQALTLLAVAELRAATGGIESAVALLTDVRSLCEPLGAKPTLARADALALQLANMRQTAPAFPAGLSAREVDVLRLLAAGKTNREIAETLFLSERTVNVHINHIYTKTRADNRAAATAFAYQHGLA